jgi:hypothetical protein
MTTNNAGCRAGGIQQDAIELRFTTPFCGFASIALLTCAFHAQTFQVVVDA